MHSSSFCRRLFHRLTINHVLTAASLLLLSAAPTARSANQPDIVLIMADDLGFSDLGCYGSEIDTPTLNQLADDGLRFTQFYNASRCCPTRAALLTGLYPHDAGIRPYREST